MVICLERGAHLHMAQLMPLPLTVSCFSKIQIGFTFLVSAHPGSPGQRAIKWVCVLPSLVQYCHLCVKTMKTQLPRLREYMLPAGHRLAQQAVLPITNNNCKILNSLKHIVRTTVAESHN